MRAEAAGPAGRPAYLRLVMKVPPATRGPLELAVVAGAGVRLCVVRLLQLGRNLHCADRPDGYTEANIQTSISYKVNIGSVNTLFNFIETLFP